MDNGIPFTFCQRPGAHSPEYGAEAIIHAMRYQYAVLKRP
jgi:hypothetical protein